MGILACLAILEFVRRRDSWLAGSRQPTTIRYAFVVNDEHTLVRLVPTLAVQCTLLPSVFLWMKRSRFLGHTKCFSLFVYSSSFRISNTLRSPGKEENTSKKGNLPLPCQTEKHQRAAAPPRQDQRGRTAPTLACLKRRPGRFPCNQYWTCFFFFEVVKKLTKCAMSSFKKILACLKQFSYSCRVTSN